MTRIIEVQALHAWLSGITDKFPGKPIGHHLGVLPEAHTT